MKNLPKKIYLQLGEFRDDADFLDTDFVELTDVTWSESDIDEYDQEYIHEDEVNKLRSLVQAQKELISRGDFHEFHTEVIELRNKIKSLEQ